MTDYKLMPEEPTQEMLDNATRVVTDFSGGFDGFNDYLDEGTARAVYAAFRAGAPDVQGEPVAEVVWPDVEGRRGGFRQFGHSSSPRLPVGTKLYATPQPAGQQSEICGYLINDGYKEQFVKTLTEENRKIAQRFNWVVTAVCRCPD